MFAAKIVVRKMADGRHVAGFASQVGRGETVREFGLWYGSQMSYRPFASAMATAREFAAKLNAAPVQAVA